MLRQGRSLTELRAWEMASEERRRENQGRMIAFVIKKYDPSMSGRLSIRRYLDIQAQAGILY
jgi:hypothetical protein